MFDRDNTQTDHARTGSHGSRDHSCSADDRGQAEQIDFLNGMIILLFGVGLFFAGGSVLFGIGVDSTADREGAALSADERLVEDLLVANVSDDRLDRDCVDAYFAENATGVCTREDGFLDGVETTRGWLDRSLGLALRANVTVVDGDGIVTSPGGIEYAIGPSPPPDAEVFESNRFVAFDDGEYRTVLVRVW